MPKSLPSAWRLVVDSWQLFLKTWNDSIKVSIWFLYFGLVYFAMYIIEHLVPNVIYFRPLLEIVVLVAWSWATIRLIETGFRLVEGKKPEVDQKALKASWKHLLPLLWVGLLQILIIIGSSIPFIIWQLVTPGLIPVAPRVEQIVSIIFMLPMLYVAVCLSFSQFIAIDRGTKGMNALAESNSLVRHRWWEIFQRQFVGYLLFGFVIWIVASLVFLILGAIVGADKVLLMSDLKTQDPVLLGISAVLQGMLQAAFMPLFILFFVKLYKSLKSA